MLKKALLCAFAALALTMTVSAEIPIPPCAPVSCVVAADLAR